jgi:hypothetical protein
MAWLIAFFLLIAPAAAQEAVINLASSILAVCPNAVFRIVDITDKKTWTFSCPDQSKQAALQALINSFDPNAPAVPQMVTAMQAKVALSRAGLLTNVQNWVNAQSAEVQLIWNTAPTFSRNSILVNNAAAALGLSQAQIDQLFITAAAINP